MVLLSQAAGLVLVVAIVGVRAEGPPPVEHLAVACASGVAGVAGLMAFYRGLAIGAMAVVAPISATAAVIPVVVGLAGGERPSGMQAAGLAVAMVGIVLASREAPKEGGAARGGRMAAGAGLALVAAAGFGCFFVAMDRASDEDVFWAILANRITGVSLLALGALLLRPRLAVGAASARALVAAGTLDITANGLFAVASNEGLVSVAAVLASLYPVVVVVLAHALLGERVRRLQQGGAAAAVAGVVLISAG